MFPMISLLDLATQGALRMRKVQDQRNLRDSEWFVSHRFRIFADAETMRLKNPIMEIQPLQVMINRGEISRWYTYSDSHASSELVYSPMIHGTFLNVSDQYVINETPPSGADFDIENFE